MGISNYDIMRDNAKRLFIRYDQKKMIRKFNLPCDSDYLYVSLVNENYRIDRKTGTVEWSDDGFATVREADFNVSMTLFDILCYSGDDCRASGQYDVVKNLKGTGYTGDPGKDIFDPYKKKFDHRNDRLKAACRDLGGMEYVVGDVSYIIPIFGDLSVLFQFWESDDEFDAQLKMKWDTNVLSYMHFETVYYAMSHLLQKLEENLS